MDVLDLANPVEFREAMSSLTSSVTIIASRKASGRCSGMTATAVCSLSTDPPSILACVNKTNRTVQAIREADWFSVNYLSEDQETIANAFARHADDEAQADAKFNHGEWLAGPEGQIRLAGAVSSLVCQVRSYMDGGSHWIVVGDVVEVVREEGVRPLLYGGRRYLRLPEL